MVHNQGHPIGMETTVRWEAQVLPGSFAASTCGVDLQDGGYNLSVQQEYQAAGYQQHYQAGGHYDYVAEGDVHTGQPDKCQYLTGHMIQHVVSTGW